MSDERVSLKALLRCNTPCPSGLIISTTVECTEEQCSALFLVLRFISSRRLGHHLSPRVCVFLSPLLKEANLFLFKFIPLATNLPRSYRLLINPWLKRPSRLSFIKSNLYIVFRVSCFPRVFVHGSLSLS